MKKEIEKETPILNIGNVGKVIISENLKTQIDYLHRKIGSTEWSGILVYKLVSGDFKNLKNLVFEATHIYLLDIGSGAYTEINYDESVAKIFSDIPEALESSLGKLHTHHNMSAYHSPTDVSDIQDNAKKYGSAFLSVTVATDGDYDAKIGIYSKVKTTFNCGFRDFSNESCNATFKNEVERVIIGDLDVEIPEQDLVPKWFTDQYESVKKAKKEAARVDYKRNNFGMGRSFGSEEDDFYPPANTKKKYETFDSKIKLWAARILGADEMNGLGDFPDELIMWFKQYSLEDTKNHLTTLQESLEETYRSVYETEAKDFLFETRLGRLIRYFESQNLDKNINVNILIKDLKNEQNG